MKQILRIAAAVLLLGGVAVWLRGGQIRGWTKTSVMTTRIEPVTGLEERVWEKRFVPGVDLLGATTLAAGALFCSSFLIRNKNH
jgi:hypothetical protein